MEPKKQNLLVDDSQFSAIEPMSVNQYNIASGRPNRAYMPWLYYDFFAAISALLLARILSPGAFHSLSFTIWVIFVIIFGLTLTLMNRLCAIPKPGVDFQVSRYEIVSSSLVSVIGTLFISFFIAFIIQPLLHGRMFILLSGIFAFIAIVSPRVIYTYLFHRPMKIVLIGSDRLINIFSKRIDDEKDWQVMGVLKSSTFDNSVDKFISHDEISTINPDTVIVCSDEELEANDVEFLMSLPFSGIEIITKGAFFEKYLKAISLDYTNFQWFAEYPVSVRHIFLEKRLLDIVVSLILLPLCLPLFLLIAILIKLESKGPVFYTQKRLGFLQLPFTMIKFRTMVVDAEKEGAQYAQKNDQRVTRVGRLLRATRLDELPQLWCVLKGDMSLVGPRPERPEFEKELSKQLPLYQRRHLSRPGITGWAQIKFKYGASIEDSRYKLEYDLYYIKHLSFLLDLRILLKTITMLMRGSR